MKKALVTVGIAILTVSLLSLLALATGWKEDRSGVQFKVDSKTGNTQVGFYLFMDYKPVPKCIEITVSWSVYPLSSPDAPLATDSHRIRRHCGGGIKSVSTLSPFITPVPGMSYAGKIVLHDVANNLTYEKQITYVTPVTLPTGIGINVTTPKGKTEEVDFSGISDADLKSLTTYYATVTTRYVQTASDVSLSDFFATYSADQPQWVFAVAQLGPQIDQTGPGISVHASYNRLFFLYLIADPRGGAAVMQQLKEFPNGFVGSIWLAKDKADTGAPQAVFMDNKAWKILQGSAKEWKKRH
ncbi:MAG TPA: hypothetical protein ENH10_05200 [Bacteroidetes bacterium]|nr:hypothetical protein [Bacteroidota bacterium]HEX04539.1 hypothetical protein [Bacteroidota bacterium]